MERLSEADRVLRRDLDPLLTKKRIFGIIREKGRHWEKIGYYRDIEEVFLESTDHEQGARP